MAHKLISIEVHRIALRLDDYLEAVLVEVSIDDASAGGHLLLDLKAQRKWGIGFCSRIRNQL